MKKKAASVCHISAFLLKYFALWCFSDAGRCSACAEPLGRAPSLLTSLSQPGDVSEIPQEPLCAVKQFSCSCSHTIWRHPHFITQGGGVWGSIKQGTSAAAVVSEPPATSAGFCQYLCSALMAPRLQISFHIHGRLKKKTRKNED